MPKHLIVVSGAGEHLKIDLTQGTLWAEPAPGQGPTYVRVEPMPPPISAPPQPSPPPPPPLGAIPRPWDITMGLMEGRPEGVSPGELETARKLKGRLSVADLLDHLNRTPEGGRTVLKLSAGPDG